MIVYHELVVFILISNNTTDDCLSWASRLYSDIKKTPQMIVYQELVVFILI
jgi:hypothetical protein